MADSAAFKPAARTSDHIAAAARADEPPASAQANRPRPAGGLLRPSQVPLPGATTRRTASPSPAGGRTRHQLRPSGAPTGAPLPLARPSTVPARPIPEVLRGPSQPLAASVQEEMETRLGADFSQVRVHTDSAARASATEAGARAYTSGSHVVIGDGGADKHTLAHELTHVIQQRQGPVPGTDHGNGFKVSDPFDVFEQAAEANAVRVMRAPLSHHRPAAGTGEQRTTLDSGEQGTIPRRGRAHSRPLPVQFRLAVDGKPIVEPAEAIAALNNFARRYKRNIDFGEYAAEVTRLLEDPTTDFNLISVDNDPGRNELRRVTQWLSESQGLQPGHYYHGETLDELVGLLMGDGGGELGLRKVQHGVYSYANGKTTKLEAALKGNAYRDIFGSEHPSEIVGNVIEKTALDGLRVLTLRTKEDKDPSPEQVGAMRFEERPAPLSPGLLNKIDLSLKKAAKTLGEKTDILESPKFKSARTQAEYSGEVGEYLAREIRLTDLPVPGLKRLTSVRFIGDVRDENDKVTRSGTDAGPELDLMEVMEDKGEWTCIGVGNVKVATLSAESKNAEEQNKSVTVLLKSYSSGTPVELASGKRALVRKVTAYDLDSRKEVVVPQGIKFDNVQRVTIGAKSSPGNYNKRLEFTVGQIADISTCLRLYDHLGAD